MRRALLPSLSFVLAAGCVPTRDNPHDPSRSPDVRIDVLRYLPDCSLPGGSSPDVVAAASRGDCLFLDVSRSTDPQGHDLTFTYLILDSSGTDVVSTIAEDTSETAVQIPNDLLGAPPSPAARFAVRAKDSTGAVSTGFFTLGLINSPPVLPEPGVLLLPEGGFPWARGVEMTVGLDGRIATDVDADDLTWCWTLPETPLYACENDTAVWTRTFPVTPGRYVFNLYVSDGDLDSDSRSFVVRVGPPALWDARDALRRFDETLRTWPEPGAGRSWIVRGDLGEEWMLFQEDASADLAIYEWPGLADTGLTIDLATPATHVTSTARAGGGTRIWLAAPGPASTSDVFVYDLDENGTALTPGRVENLAIVDRTVFDADAFADVAVLAGGDAVALVPGDAADGLVMTYSSAGLIVEGGSARPKAEQEGEAAHFLLVGSVPGGAVYLSYQITPSASGPQVVPESMLFTPPMRQFEWIDHDRLWSLWPGAGLTLFEINNFRVFTQVPEIQEVEGPLLVDATGAVHFMTASALVSVASDGRVERHPQTAPVRRIDFVSADGTLAVDDGNGVMRFSRTASRDALRTSVDLTPAHARRSVASGGVWAASGPAIVQLSEDGRVVRSITALDLESKDDPLLYLPEVAIDPDERGGWVRDLGGVYRMNELEIDPLFPHDEEAFVVNAPIEAADFQFAGASGPASPAPFLWMWSALTNEVATLGTQGTFASSNPLPGSPIASVVDTATNDLCVFTQVNATTVRHHRFTPGLAELFDDVTVPDASLIVSPFTFPDPPICGVVVGSAPSRVFVWDASATLVASLVDADEITSVIPVADGDYWAAGTEGSGDRFLTRMVAGSAGSLTRTATWTIDVPFAPEFLP